MRKRLCFKNLPLARALLAQEGKAELVFTASAKKTLGRYPWPGNVRELFSAVRHGIALSREGVIDLEHLPEEVASPPPPGRAGARATARAPRV